MAFTIDFCKDEDFPAMVPMMFASMAEQSQFVNAVYPHNMIKEGQEKHCQTLLFVKSIDPSQRWLKATDNATGDIVGVAQWNVYDGPKPPEIELDGPDGIWDTQDDKEWAQALFRAFMEYRRKVIREATGPVMCLTIMTVAPHYQYRGVGTALTKWGTELADKMGAECVVESSLAGRLLYEQQGFIMKHHYALAVPEKFADRKKERLFFMHRPRKTQT